MFFPPIAIHMCIPKKELWHFAKDLERIFPEHMCFLP